MTIIIYKKDSKAYQVDKTRNQNNNNSNVY